MHLPKRIKLYLCLSSILTGLFAQTSTLVPYMQGMAKLKSRMEKSSYVNNQVIIKFKDAAAVGTVADALVNRGQTFSSIGGSPNLDALFRKYNIKKMHKLDKSNINTANVNRQPITRQRAESLRNDLIKEKNKSYGSEKRMAVSNIYVAYFNDKKASVVKIIDELKKEDEIEFAVPNYRTTVDMIPNDQLYEEQWSHVKTDAQAAWDIQRGSADVVVAVLDLGVDYNHPDLSANIWHDLSDNPGRDFTDIDTNVYKAEGIILSPDEDYTGIDNEPLDFYGHGTHCAGIAGAVGNNGVGIAGVSHLCKIMPVRIGCGFENGNTVELDDCIAGIMYAADNDADIISMSFGYGNLDDTACILLKNALDYAESKGCLLVSSAGNDRSDIVKYPAHFDNVLAVASTDKNDIKAPSSNFGFWIDVAAPGDNIVSTVPFSGGTITDSTGYKSMGGTSMSCPYVAGFAALLKAQFPSITATELRGRICASADDLSGTLFETSRLGAGRVNVEKGFLISDQPYCMIRDVKITDLEGEEQYIIKPNTTIKFALEIENVWKYASNVTVTLDVNSSSITLSNSVIDFQSLNTNEKKNNFASPTTITIGDIDEDVIEKAYTLNLTISADGSDIQRIVYLVVSINGHYVESDDEIGAGHDVSGQNVVFSVIEPDQDRVIVKRLNTVTQKIDVVTKGNEYEGLKWAILPKISKHTVLWNDSRFSNLFEDDIFEYDFLTGTENVVDSSAGWQMYPEIASSTVVWGNIADIMDPDLNADIVRFDLNTSQLTSICTSPFLQGNPSVYGTNIVWEDYRQGNDVDPDIYRYNGTAESSVSTGSGSESHPQIFGNYIVWVDNRNGNNDIYMYTISTGTETPVCTDPADQNAPHIFGDRIVWSDYRNGMSNIYLYDIETQTESRLTHAPYNQSSPRISANKIVWVDYAIGNGQYRYADLEHKYLGDVNGDHSVNNADALFILQYVSDVRSFNELQWENSDVNVDGYVSIHDFKIVANYLIGNISELRNPYRIGDINGDGNIDNNDYMLIDAVVNLNGSFNELQEIIADVNGDQQVTADDLVLYDQYLNNTITEFPFPKK